MDIKFTEKVQAWLDTPAEERDYDQGAIFLLQLSNNQIMYRNLSRNTKKNAQFIEYQIRKYMKFRLADLTHAQVTEMQKAVDKIVALRHLDREETPVNVADDTDVTGEDTGTVNKPESTNVNVSSEFKAGKRADHDSLPIEIQALYVENGNIIHKMRELHMRLRSLSAENATCPDSERYPFLKELIALDKQYHKNWQVYDSWSAELQVSESKGSSLLESSAERAGSRHSQKAAEGAEQQLIEDERQAQKNIYRQINLTKGRYKKNPTDSLKEQIASLYSQLASPIESLTAELRELGILPDADSPEVESATVDTAPEDNTEAE